MCRSRRATPRISASPGSRFHSPHQTTSHPAAPGSSFAPPQSQESSRRFNPTSPRVRTVRPVRAQLSSGRTRGRLGCPRVRARDSRPRWSAGCPRRQHSEYMFNREAPPADDWLSAKHLRVEVDPLQEGVLIHRGLPNTQASHSSNVRPQVSPLSILSPYSSCTTAPNVNFSQNPGAIFPRRVSAPGLY
jgi:hypothetical protein